MKWSIFMSNYDGDEQTDLGVWRETDGTFYVRTSSTDWTSGITKQWGTSGDEPLSGDYTGDGKDDFVVWRPSDGTWYIATSESDYTASLIRPWGTVGDVPLGGAD